jgi:dihydrofolate reductase
MRKVIGSAFVSLDGVIQGPGGRTEDPTGGFALSGWLPAFMDEEVGERVGALFSGPFDLLLGRRTYDIFAAYWPYVEGGPKALGESFDRAAKYVLTRGDQALDWENSHRLAGMDALAEVKAGDGPDLIVQGSATLYPQLLAAGLIDRLTLMTFPLVLGPGKRLFGEGTAPRSLALVEHQVTARGTVIATYEPAGPVETGSFYEDRPSAAELVRRQRMADGSW